MLAMFPLTPCSPLLTSDLSLLLWLTALAAPLLGGKDTGSSLKRIYDLEQGRRVDCIPMLIF